MKKTEVIEMMMNYFQENEEEFNALIEELDSWDGYLGDDRYYEMYMIDEFYADCKPSELLDRIYYGHDDDNGPTSEFCPNREYFYYNGYGNLVSSDVKDYSAHLDHWFCEKVIDEECNLYEIPDEVQEMIDSIEEDEEATA